MNALLCGALLFQFQGAAYPADTGQDAARSDVLITQNMLVRRELDFPFALTHAGSADTVTAVGFHLDSLSFRSFQNESSIFNFESTAT